MPERDAFGNEIGPSDAGTTSAGPAAKAAFGSDTEPSERPARRPSRAGAVPARPRPDAVPAPPLDTTASRSSVAPRVAGGCVSFLALVLVVGGCAVAGLVGAVSDGVETFRSLSTELSVPPPVPSPGGTPSRRAAVPPRGLERRSLLRRAEFSRALTRLRTAGLGRPRLLRVAPDRIDTQLATRTGRLRSVKVLPGGRLRTLSATTSGGSPGQDLLALASVDRGAPQRLARAAAGRARLPVTRIDYLVLSTAGGTSRWTVFFRNGPAYSADRTGRIERAIR